MEDYVKIPVSLFQLPDELFKLYGAIRSFDWEKGKKREGCVAKVETLAQMVGKSERATQVNLAKLEACGAVRIERRPHLPNVILCTPETFDPSRVKPTAPRSRLHPEADCTLRVKPTAEKGEAHCTLRVKPTAPELDTFKQIPEADTFKYGSAEPAAPVAAPLFLAPQEAPRKPAKAARKPAADKTPALTTPTWNAFSAAYAQRHGAEPVRDYLANRQLKEFIERVGVDDAPAIAAHYVGDSTAYYVTQRHPIFLLVRDYQKLRTNWLTGQRINAHTARQNEQTAGNAAWAYAQELERKEREGQ